MHPWMQSVACLRAGAERSQAVLSASAEDSLKAAVYDGAYSGSSKAQPALVLLGFLRQPFTDLRIATYRHRPSHTVCMRSSCNHLNHHARHSMIAIQLLCGLHVIHSHLHQPEMEPSQQMHMFNTLLQTEEQGNL